MALREYPAMIAALCCCLTTGQAQDEDNDDFQGSLRIEPTAELYTAQLMIRMMEGEQLTSLEMDGDKRRAELGIGESVTLEVKGKPALIGDESKTDWEVEEGGEYVASRRTTEEGAFEIAFRKNLSADGTVKVKAKTEEGMSTTIELQILVPNRMTGQHAREDFNMPVSPTNPRGTPAPGYLFSEHPERAGVSASIEVTAHPVSVNFSNAFWIERDAGFRSAQLPPLAKPHHPNPNPLGFTIRNIFRDAIGTSNPVIACYPLPQQWAWVCRFHTIDEGKDCALMGIVDQEFSYDGYNSIVDYGNITAAISKFGCSATRNTLMGDTNYTGGSAQ